MLERLSETSSNVLVTGAARRIGAALATDLATAGFGVVLHANTSVAEAEETATFIRSTGGRAAVITGDLSSAQGLSRIVDRAAREIGPLSVLVNNASIFEPDEIETLDIERFDRHFAIHTRAPLFLSQAFAEQLPDEASGLIVNIIDQKVWRPTPKFLSYTLSKSALWSATRMLAQGLAPRIRVNAIGPGPTLASERQSAEDFRRQQEAVPLGRGPELVEFANTILYLWRTPSITGQMIALDGGQHLAWETPDVVGIRE
ncbi:SDR family oxidoreductase [Stappia sp. GBMRC 2046]|uniref:SDR family oxidoreductase n=1 Tax=Stappia sediminis TaxID=2692190 RepID=A0A7X3LQT3_9HYPH|nr:SDR family oxidoreductase [Stappia sediminis]MXN63379.1 SDR family oxidoreductase [Stappia sediminis]